MKAFLTKNHWIETLELQPHPEGGYYKETFRSNSVVIIPSKSNKPYNTATAIYFLLGSASKGDFSAWHRLNDLEETWYYNYGDDLSIYWIDTTGNLITHKLGIGPGASLQVHIPANVWFAAAVANKNPEAYCLVSCMVYPGFDFADFQLGDRSELIAEYPQHKEIIEILTRTGQQGANDEI